MGDNVLSRVVNRLVGLGISRIEEVTFADELLADRILGQVFGMSVEDVARLARRLLPGPDKMADEPAMDFNARRAAVALFDDLGQGVEVNSADGPGGGLGGGARGGKSGRPA